MTHDMEEAIRLGNKIAVMDGGKLIQYATPHEILAKPANDFVQTLIGTADRPFRLLSLGAVSSLVEKGDAPATPFPHMPRSATPLPNCSGPAGMRCRLQMRTQGRGQGHDQVADRTRRETGGMTPTVPNLLRLVALALLLAFILSPETFAPVFRPLTQNGAPPIYNQGSLLWLTIQHLGLVLAATACGDDRGRWTGDPGHASVGPRVPAVVAQLVNIGQTFHRLPSSRWRSRPSASAGSRR